MTARACAWLAAAALLLTANAEPAPTAPAEGSSASNALARELLRQLIAINTTDTPRGNVTMAAEAMAQQLRSAGFSPADIQVLGPSERKKNLVVRLRGSGQHQPVLLIGHLDVVEARREDWSSDPFGMVEKDGYLYGRGTLDMKGPDAIMLAALIRLKQEGFRPARDITVALTADEEGGGANGVEWLLQHHRELIGAQFVLSGDDYSVLTENGKPLFFKLVASEKVYADFQLRVTNKGGHSSEPVADNAIYTLIRGLDRLAAYEFPFELNAVTREYYRRLAQIESGQRAADMRAILRDPPDAEALGRLSRRPLDRSITRTTCVATRLEAGHANNALPQRAQAVVNCRILPGHSPEEVRRQLVQVLGNPAITVSYLASDGALLDAAPSVRGFAPPPLVPEMLMPLDRLVAQTWPGLKVIPCMSAGASDATHTSAAGLPTYTFSPLTVDPNDDREHGRDERISVASFYEANEFFYRYLRTLTAP
ncbi:MAG TPA: M20/M25/M40 family metallo-hydrolase [Steroidobacteraceae bacterium]|nr:M20/M25/M40 family metallo-hydrolase [Steroidobacteraceae bacterium]